MNWWMFLGAMVIGGIGLAMVIDGDNYATQAAGSLVMGVSALLTWFSLGLGAHFDYPDLDKEKCAQYVQMQGHWTCVPWEEAG